jgi:hypothetical protein
MHEARPTLSVQAWPCPPEGVSRGRRSLLRRAVVGAVVVAWLLARLLLSDPSVEGVPLFAAAVLVLQVVALRSEARFLRTLLRSFRLLRRRQVPRSTAARRSLIAALPPAVGRLASWELSVWSALTKLTRRRRPPGQLLRYGFDHRMFCLVILVVSLFEGAGLHLVLPHGWIRNVVDVVHVLGAAYLLGLWARVAANPHSLDGDRGLQVRHFDSVRVWLDRGAVRTVVARTERGRPWDTATIRDGVMRLPVQGTTTVRLVLAAIPQPTRALCDLVGDSDGLRDLATVREIWICADDLHADRLIRRELRLDPA